MTKPNPFTAEQISCLQYTVSHFQEIARQNRFAENSTIEHELSRCVICHPDLIPQAPFLTYLDVVAPSVMVRRPRLDQDLVDAINGDLAMMGEDHRVSIEFLEAGDDRAKQSWTEWIRSALATGLGLLSVHSSTSIEFDLDEAEEQGFGPAIERKVQEIMKEQREGSLG
jgi:hypothetical protein